MNAINLPILSLEAKTFTERLTAHIAAEIKAHGEPITFARYMQLALYAPGLGYYRGGAQKFGATGDFITAPEISPLFSQCVARQCEQVLKDFPGGDILELGAGSGVMALEMMKMLEKKQQLPAHYFILEVSSDLQQRQRELFQQKAPHLLAKIQWLTTLPTIPISGVIVANEVIDAMPIHKFKIQKNGPKEFFVDEKDHEFFWRLDHPSTTELAQRIHELDRILAEDYESEINLMLPAWIASLAHCLQRGLLLLIDYGFSRDEYYHPDRKEGTLMCHYRHHAHADPLIFTGIQDITAHVDFTAVAEAAYASQLSVSGYTTQANFLLNCGITDLQSLPHQNPWEQYQTAQQIKRLTLPSEMGELFKALALTRNYEVDLLGFSSNNQVERLACRVW